MEQKYLIKLEFFSQLLNDVEKIRLYICKSKDYTLMITHPEFILTKKLKYRNGRVIIPKEFQFLTSVSSIKLDLKEDTTYTIISNLSYFMTCIFQPLKEDLDNKYNELIFQY